MPEFSFKKGERLAGKKNISSLFQTGRSFTAFPLRLIFHQVETGTYPAVVAISVPKRLFKNAVDRNLLKRRIREAYRQEKPEFYARLKERQVTLQLVFQYQHREILDYHTIKEGLIKGMDQLLSQINE